MSLKLTAALLALLLGAASPAAADEELPRHKPRTTLPAGEEPGAAAAKKKKVRRNTRAIDDDGAAAEEEPAAKKKPAPPPETPATRAGDDELPPPGQRSHPVDDEEKPGHSATRERHESTMEEEEKGAPQLKEERLATLDEPGKGFAAEVVFGGILLDAATGGSTGKGALGLHFNWRLGRLFAPENEFLHEGLFLDFSYLYSRATNGTTEVNVLTSYHNLALALVAGYPFGAVLPYLKAGPAMFLMPVHYSASGTETDFTGVKGGLVYGGGVRGSFYFGDVGVAAGVELTRFRRQYMNDTLIGASVGVAF